MYRIAASGGLNYGPAFRLIESAHIDGDLISVELAPSEAATGFLLDPLRADCCCQGILTLLPELRAEERGVAYLPIRMDEAVLLIRAGFRTARRSKS